MFFFYLCKEHETAKKKKKKKKKRESACAWEKSLWYKTKWEIKQFGKKKIKSGEGGKHRDSKKMLVSNQNSFFLFFQVFYPFFAKCLEYTIETTTKHLRIAQWLSLQTDLLLLFVTPGITNLLIYYYYYYFGLSTISLKKNSV